MNASAEIQPGTSAAQSSRDGEFDAVVIGAGFGGLYMLYRLRDVLGMKVRVYEAGEGVGGTWYWNRYPGARCDSPAYMYCYSFDQDLLQEWNWSGKYPLQPEILEYLNHVADRFALRDDIQLSTRVTSAHYREGDGRWVVETDRGDRVTAQFVVTAVGCLSAGQTPKIAGLDTFEGERYYTSSWPHEGVDLRGKRVGVIGTGSSGMQVIPEVAKQAEHLYVFQRTAQYSIPARHHTVDRAYLDDVKRRYDELWEQARWSSGGLPRKPAEHSAFEFTAEERQEILEAAWALGGTDFVAATFKDVSTDKRVNDMVAEFIRAKIRKTVEDPETAEKLTPVDHPFGSKRTLIDTDYFATYNRPNVTLVDVRVDPIRGITATGIHTEDETYDLDVIVFATGFDAVTGSLLKIDIRGRDGLPLREKWAEGPKSYLGLGIAGFPNLLTITGPGSPSVLSNMPVSIEQHVEWISDLIAHMRVEGLETVEAEPEAEAAWVEHVNELAESTMYMLADSWYLGANIPGKPRVFMPYTGGVGNYRRKCDEVREAGYEGFRLSAARSD